MGDDTAAEYDSSKLKNIKFGVPNGLGSTASKPKSAKTSMPKITSSQPSASPNKASEPSSLNTSNSKHGGRFQHLGFEDSIEKGRRARAEICKIREEGRKEQKLSDERRRKAKLAHTEREKQEAYDQAKQTSKEHAAMLLESMMREARARMEAEYHREIRDKVDEEITRFRADYTEDSRQEVVAMLEKTLEPEVIAKLELANIDKVKASLAQELKGEVENNLKVELEPMVVSDLEDSLRDQVKAKLAQELRNEVLHGLKNELREEVGEELYAQMEANRRSPIRAETEDVVFPAQPATDASQVESKAEPIADDSNSGVIDDKEMAIKVIDFGAIAPNQKAITTKLITANLANGAAANKPEALINSTSSTSSSGSSSGSKANSAVNVISNSRKRSFSDADDNERSVKRSRDNTYEEDNDVSFEEGTCSEEYSSGSQSNGGDAEDGSHKYGQESDHEDSDNGFGPDGQQPLYNWPTGVFGPGPESDTESQLEGETDFSDNESQTDPSEQHPPDQDIRATQTTISQGTTQETAIELEDSDDEASGEGESSDDGEGYKKYFKQFEEASRRAQEDTEA